MNKFKNKCNYCNKKLIITIKCSYCENLYCLIHKYPDTHECENIDKIIVNNKKKLIKENPLIKSEIIDKI